LLKSLALITVAIVMAGAGQVSLKLGMSVVGRIGEGTDPAETARRIVSSPLVLVGLVCYAVGAVVWLIVLSRVNLSLAYPLLALSYVVVTAAAQLFLGEQVSPLRWLGVVIVSLGVAIIVRG
jgi:drug/metabolite transporter (DMT)-like permease